MEFKYKHRLTGAVITVPCRLEGPCWEEITEAKSEPEAAPAKAKTATKRKAKSAD